jgi:hypothetical protein
MQFLLEANYRDLKIESSSQQAIPHTTKPQLEKKFK